ncbi:hypothetical protein PHLGIDRAFT_22040 [Phlebiopsis gigantea 11061_1 CR5-6]|uniref:Major facilitator superfamily (MFS) profile domain-containing protein n=1 Tax=Phlebiopsis gigantea (strain 11061_1 CR5-6) TaxID=745531 RepID=A0A0C3NZ81_PHLG1|nr:hypothetical protein PHLGIDRAFT_22040 [Phlebiopsis gigantea 11061_1 CR5-6]
MSLQVPSVAHGRSSISSETSQGASLSSDKTGKQSTASRSSNPLVGVSVEQLLQDAEKFARDNGLDDHVEIIQKGALVAQNPEDFEDIDMLTEDEKAALRHEAKKPWSQPKMLYYLVIMCSLAAALQGMDESVINGANLFFPGQFGIDPGFMNGGGANRNQWLLGLVNSAPYLCCAVFSCWLTAPLNYYFGRRGAIFITTVISFLACIWQTVTDTWWHLFIARFVLGIGIGPNSATVPVFAAECAPSRIRGSLVTMWQVYTAFGIMLGYAVDLAFLRIPNKPHITGLNWRLMLGSASVPALLLLSQIWFTPESPRWLVSKGRHADAFKSLLQLRNSSIEAARDIYYTSVMNSLDKQRQPSRNLFAELFGIRRNRRAAVASLLLMFMQQFCGVNAIAYYSSNIFTQSGFSNVQALLASWGFGLTNWLFAFPAFFTIDRFGRRKLLLVSYPWMSLFLLIAGLAFLIPSREPRIAVIATGIYLFTIAYSPGAGPVPFAYSAEAYPSSIRDFGMSLSTAWLWFFNFVVAITFPPLIGAFTPTGAFAWYAAWNAIGFVAAFLLVPETKGQTLEELDNVFSMSAREFARSQVISLRELPRTMKQIGLHRETKTPAQRLAEEA